MLGKVFVMGAEHGLTQDFIRDVIAPNLIGKRLSAASEKEISLVITHITGPKSSNRPSPTSPTRGEATASAKKYPSSMQGLRDEIKDLAKARWGESWSSSLNSLCRRFGIEHYNFLDLAHGKAVKQRLITWEDKTHHQDASIHRIERGMKCGPRPQGEGVKDEEVRSDD
jgi:hypothetical protein